MNMDVKVIYVKNLASLVGYVPSVLFVNHYCFIMYYSSDILGANLMPKMIPQKVVKNHIW